MRWALEQKSPHIPYTFTNCLETDQIKAYKTLQFVPILRSTGNLPAISVRYNLPLISQTDSLPLRNSLLVSYCFALEAPVFEHKKVSEENYVLKLVPKQKIKKLKEDPRKVPV